MFCPNCAFDLSNEKASKIEKKEKVLKEEEKKNDNAEVVYVCPRCGKLIHEHLAEPEYKRLSQAAHSEVHRAKNTFNGAMCALGIGATLVAISILFLMMSFKVANQRQLDVECIEFVVFCVLAGIGSICIIGGIIALINSLGRKNKYSTLISRIQNKSFVQ